MCDARTRGPTLPDHQCFGAGVQWRRRSHEIWLLAHCLEQLGEHLTMKNITKIDVASEARWQGCLGLADKIESAHAVESGVLKRGQYND